MIFRKIKLWFIVGIIVLGIFVVGYLYIRQTHPEEERLTPFLSSPTPPLPEEIFSFDNDFKALEEGGKVIEGAKVEIYPKFLRLGIHPFKAPTGTFQTLLIAAEDPDGIQKVIAIVEDEVQKQKEVELSLSKGEQKRGLWRGWWEIKKVENKAYRIIFVIRNQAGIQHSMAIEWEGI